MDTLMTGRSYSTQSTSAMTGMLSDMGEIVIDTILTYLRTGTKPEDIKSHPEDHWGVLQDPDFDEQLKKAVEIYESEG